MLGVFNAIASVFSLILIGVALKHIFIKNEDYWLQVNRLVYWIIMPAFLFNHTSQIKIDLQIAMPLSLVLLAGLVVAIASTWSIGRALKIESQSISSMVQASARHNTFISLAMAQSLFDENGMVIALLATSVLIPMANFLVVTSIVLIHHDKQSKIGPKLMSETFKNPMLVSIAIGFLFNFLGYQDIFIIHSSSAILGQAALPMVLLSIGASLKFKSTRNVLNALITTSLIKFFIYPLVVFSLCLYFELSPLLSIIAVIYAATPTAVASYSLARSMGGNHELMATLVSFQTLLGLLTLPITVAIVMRIVGL